MTMHQDAHLASAQLQPSPPLHTTERHTIGILCEEALAYILTLAADCHTKGGYTIDEAMQLQKHTQKLQQSISPARTDVPRMTGEEGGERRKGMETVTDNTPPEDTLANEQRAAAVEYVMQHLTRAQHMGHLTLHEAWMVYNAQKLLLGGENTFTGGGQSRHVNKPNID